MAIVKNNYVKRGRGEKARAKATIRYMQHRPGKDGQKVTRTLFGSDGVLNRQQAYQMIDDAKRGTIFFRIIISPDPKREDRERDLDLQEITTQTMQTLEERLEKQVQWVAVEHGDHAPHRHVHAVVLVQGRLGKEDFQALRQAATEAALFQRRARDLARERRRERLPNFRSPAADRAGQGRGGAALAPIVQACPRCWYGQEMDKLSRSLYQCPSCGLVVRRTPGVGIRIEEVQWNR